MSDIEQNAREAMIRAASEQHRCLDGAGGCTHTDCYYAALLAAGLSAINYPARLEALEARLRQEVDAHRMTLHDRALPLSDEEWQGYLGTIPGFEEGR